MNIIITDGVKIIATRFSNRPNEESALGYTHTKLNNEILSVTLSSEPLNSHDKWFSIEKNHLFSFDREKCTSVLTKI